MKPATSVFLVVLGTLVLLSLGRTANARSTAGFAGTIAVTGFHKDTSDPSVYLVSRHGSARRIAAGTALSWSPDRSRLLVVRGQRLFVVRANGTTEFALPNHVWDVAWSPDGRRLAFARPSSPVREELAGARPMYLMNANGSGLRSLRAKVVEGGRSSFDHDIAWFPGGKTIVFSNGHGFSTLDVDGGSKPKELVLDPPLDPAANPAVAVYSPEVSSNGKRIAFLTGDVPFLADADGQNVQAIAGTNGGPVFAWSPDGSKLAVTGSGVFVVHADGSGLTQLSRRVCYWCGLTWSPDGKQVAYLAQAVGRFQTSSSLYVVRVDGSEPRLVLRKTGLYFTNPLWEGGTADNGN